MSMTNRLQRHSAGFSLLEILVAFSIMALSLGVLLRIFSGSTLIARTDYDYIRAITIAESLLDSLGVEVEIKPGVTSGMTKSGYAWEIAAEPYDMTPDQLTQRDQPIGLPYWITLEVSWGELGNPRAINIDTLRIIDVHPNSTPQ